MTEMTMKDIYELMKDALNFFDVRFHDMDKINVSQSDGSLVFTQPGSEVSVSIPLQEKGESHESKI